MAETSVMTALRTGTEDRQYAKNSDAQIAMALQALALRQKQEAGREQEQAQQQKMQGAKYLADKQMAGVPPPPPPQAMAPGQPSVPMQPPQQGGVPPPPMGGSMMAQPQPQQAPAVPPQQPTPWMTSRAAPPSLGGQPPAPTASSEVGNPPAAPNTGVDMPKIRDPKEIFKTIESTPELANLPLYEKGQLADAMAETMSKQNKAVVEKWKIEQEVEDAKRRAGKQAEEDSLVKLFGHKPSAEELKLFFVTGDMAKAKALGLQQEQKKAMISTGGEEGKPPSGYRWSKENKDELQAIPGGPADPEVVASKKNAIQISGGRESVYTTRVMQAANQASKDLANIAKLPVESSTGWLGGRHQGPGLFDATKEVLAQKMTPQSAQTYNVMATGLQRSLAAVETSGLAQGIQEFSKQIDVVAKEGDTELTKLHKMAQMRQIIEAGLEPILANPRVAETEKELVRKAIDNVHASVPFTHSDLIELVARQEANPKTTLREILPKMGMKKEGPAPKTVTTKAEYDALPVGTHFLDKDGKEWVRH